MKTIVITGSTRGIGFGLANEFLKMGCNVMVSGRTQTSVDKAVAALTETHDASGLAGFPCNASELQHVEALWDAAAVRFGRIDIWINNAGLGQPSLNGWEVPPEVVANVVTTNVLGTMYGTRVAIQKMTAQGSGFIYNLEGFGSRGDTRKGSAIYSTTKAAITYYSKAIRKEAAELPVKIGTIRPGMVITDMVMDAFKDDPSRIESVRKIFSIVASRVEEVVPFVAEKILENEKDGAIIDFMPRRKLLWRFISAPFSKRDVLP